MKTCILPRILVPFSFPWWGTPKRCISLLLGILLSGAAVHGQRTEGGTDVDRQTIQVLLQKIEQLEAADKQLQDRVTQLEKAQAGSAQGTLQSPSQAGEFVAKKSDEQSEATDIEPDKMDVGKTLLNIQGFGDFSFHGDNRKGDTTAFSIGQLDLFITSNLSDRFKFLTELVFEVHKNNEFEEDLERVLLEYSYNDHLRLAAGRYHSAIGYYNTSHHHTNWFESATDRPFLFDFEDEGGILPIHSVGLSASGEIPSGKLGLNYIAEVGNGRASRSPLLQPVQNLVDENNHKDVNLAFFARPEAVPGLQVGFSIYRDVLYPFRQPKIGETIFDVYGVVVRPNFEWLNEALLIRHAPEGLSHVYETPGFYTQISKRFGSYRPYLRYQYVNASNAEPVFPDLGLRTGPSVGLRYAANDAVGS